jgi:hypothetical protein
METPPPKIDPTIVFPALCEILESLGYHIQKCNVPFRPTTSSPCISRVCRSSIIANLFNSGIEIACHWPCTDTAKANTEAFAVFVNSLNALCRSVTCLAEPQTMTIRAYYPFNFQPDSFRLFIEAWMEDAADILAEVQREGLGFLDIATVH